MRILLLDTDRTTARLLEHELPDAATTLALAPAEGLALVQRGGWDLVLLDAGFAGEGLALLGAVRGQTAAPVTLLSAEPTMELTLQAIRAGAQEVLPKPPAPERVRELLQAALAAHHVRALPTAPRGEAAIIGSSPQMLDVFSTVARAAASDATVLLLGESGTGKEMIAHVLHRQSPRARGPYVALNCAAIPETLLESELFGHEKGAFTGAVARRVGRFERASGGTLFLDEIGDMSLALQAKILRALQERRIERVGGGVEVPVDVRVVAATHRDLAADVRQGRFREDLFYRLAVVSLRLPPLRERGADLERLVEHFVTHYAHEHRRPIRGIAEATLARLRAHPWPGNVRQLRNAIERAVVMSSGEVLLPQHLAAELLHEPPEPPAPRAAPGPLLTLAELERRHIQRALVESAYSLSLAARRLGIHRNTLRRKMGTYGLGRAVGAPAADE